MKSKAKYAPFVKINGRWQRVGMDGKLYSAYSKDTAVKVYQNWLLVASMGLTSEIRALRKVQD